MFAGNDDDQMRKTQNGFGKKNWKSNQEHEAIGGLQPPEDDDSDEDEGVDDEEEGDDEDIVDEDEEESDHNF